MKKQHLIFENKHYSTNSTFYAKWEEKLQYYIVGTGYSQTSDGGYIRKYDSNLNNIKEVMDNYYSESIYSVKEIK